MQETQFLNICEQDLESLADLIESKDSKSNLDIEYSDGILEIEIISKAQKYIINRNSGNQKIWYSSPLTGADYFSYNQQEKLWQNDQGVELKEKLLQELQQFL